MGCLTRLLAILTALDTEWRPIVVLQASPNSTTPGPTRLQHHFCQYNAHEQWHYASILSPPSVMRHWTRFIAILTALDTKWWLHADNACQSKLNRTGAAKASPHQFHQHSSSEQWQCAYILSIPSRMDHQTRLTAILTALDTKWWLNVLLLASPNSVTPGHLWGCSNTPINALRLISDNVLLYYHYQVWWATKHVLLL